MIWDTYTCIYIFSRYRSFITKTIYKVFPSIGWSFHFLNGICLKKCLFIFFETERESVSMHMREEETEFPVQSLPWGLISPLVRSWSEPKSRVRCLPYWATQGPLNGFEAQMLILIMSNLSTFSFVDSAFGVISKKPWHLIWGHLDFLLRFLSQDL